MALIFQRVSFGSGSKYRELTPINPNAEGKSNSSNSIEKRPGQSNFSENVEENIVVQPGKGGSEKSTSTTSTATPTTNDTTETDNSNAEVNLLNNNSTSVSSIPVETDTTNNSQETTTSNNQTTTISDPNGIEIPVEIGNSGATSQDDTISITPVENNIINNSQETTTSETNTTEAVIPLEITNDREIIEENSINEVNVLDNNIATPTDDTGSGIQDNNVVQNAGDIPKWVPQSPISDRNVEYGQLEDREGIFYVKEENTPYTGTLTSKFGAMKEYEENYSNGKLHGDKVWYSEEGKPVVVDVYKNGRLDGTSFEYYLNGATKTVKVYVDNKISSIKSYNKAGNIIHQSEFTDGSGHWKIFWETGNPLEEGNYKNGVKDGEWKRYQSNGTVDNIKTYNNGKLVGETWN